MAYNLYQVQQSNAWAQRIEKENAAAEKFHLQGPRFASAMDSSLLGASNATSARRGDYYPAALHASIDVAYPDVAGSASPAKSVAPSGFTTKTGFLRSKMEKLEAELDAERESRRRVEADLADLKSSMRR